MTNIRLNFIAFIVIGLLAALASTGCRDAEAVPAKQIFVYNNGILPKSLDTAVNTDVASRNILMQIFEGLTVYQARDLSPQPGVAKRWEISKDGKTYTFYLKPEALWSDGSRVTADDFVFAWRRVLDPKTAAPFAYYLYGIKNGRAYNKGEITDPALVGVKALAPDVLEVTLENNIPYFLQLTSFFTLFPVPKKQVQQYGASWADPSKIVTNGPFLVIGKPEANLMLLKKNNRYWGASSVRLQEVRIYGIQDSVQAVKLYAEGKLDYSGETPIPSQEIPKWRYTSDYHSVPFFAVNFLRFNTTRAPFDNVDVRRAINMAIDKVKIVNFVVPGGHQPTQSMVPTGVDGYTPPQSDTFDVQHARDLLQKAGYCVPKGPTEGCKAFPTFSIMVDNNDAEKKLVLGIQQMLKKDLGMEKIELRVIPDFQRYLELRRKMDYDIVRSRWLGDYYDPNAFLEIWSSDNVNNNTGWKNSRYDELLRQASGEHSERKRYELLRQAEQILLNDLPVAPIYNFSQIYLLKPYVRNFADNLQRIVLFKDLYIEHYTAVK